MKVTCEIRDFSEPAKPSVRVHNSWKSNGFVELEVEGKRYTVLGYELIESIKNCMNKYNG